MVGALRACRDCGVQKVPCTAVCLGTAPACLQSNIEMFCMSAYAKYASRQPPVGLHIRSSCAECVFVTSDQVVPLVKRSSTGVTLTCIPYVTTLHM
jgi:hypothetical protein